MNAQPLEAAPAKLANCAKKLSTLEANAIGLGAIAAASGLAWLFDLHPLDKVAIALHTCAVLIYFAALGEGS